MELLTKAKSNFKGTNKSAGKGKNYYRTKAKRTRNNLCITYIDHHTKCVFNGSDLGKQYSAAGIQQRCQNYTQVQAQSQGVKQTTQEKASSHHNAITEITNNLLEPIKAVMQPTEDKSYVPSQFKNKEKRRRRQGYRQ
jgi:hypothetical protein